MQKKNISKKVIPLQLYKKIVNLVPICCVDIVLKSGDKVFLFKRAYQPEKNKWWIIGGRVWKGEKLKDAAIRKAKEEVGLDVKILKEIGTYEVFLPHNRFGTSTHAIGICYLVEPKRKNFRLKLNSEYLGYKTISKIDKSLHSYVKQALKDSGVFRK